MGTTRNKPYRAYMRSRKWKRFRKGRISDANEKCEKCGRSLASLHRTNLRGDESCSLDQAVQDIATKPPRKRKRWRTNTLQVHHVWYDNLYNETNLDTRVLCKTPCHKQADAKRKKVQGWLFKKGFYQSTVSKHNRSFKSRVMSFLCICWQCEIKIPRYVSTYLTNGY